MCSEERVQRLQFWFYKESSSFCTVFHGSHQTELKNTITIAIYIRYLNICRAWYTLCGGGSWGAWKENGPYRCRVFYSGSPAGRKVTVDTNAGYGQTHTSADTDVQGWGLWTDTVIFMGFFRVSHSGFKLFLFNVVYWVFLFLSFYVPWLTRE